MSGRFSLWHDYRELPPTLVRYLVLVSICGPAGAVLWMLIGPASERPDRWFVFAILTVLACLAERFPIHLTHKTYVNVSSAVYVAMLLMLPLTICGVAALVVATGAATWRLSLEPELGVAECLFNIGQTALYVTAAAVCVSAVDQWHVDALTIGDIPLIQVIVASAALHCCNCLLVAGASARHLAVPTLRVWRKNLLIDIGPHAGMTMVGLCAAQLGFASPILIPALAIPALLVHRAAIGSVQLRQNVRQALESLVEVVELRDPYTAGHSRRVAQLARQIALELGLTAEEADQIEAAGNLHDLGKVALDPAILLKPGKLTDAEWAEMKRHPVYGASVLNRFESYREGIDLIRGHHEAWDGSGYPDGLRGDAIPLGARILAVADAYDALTSDRPYRKGMDPDRAIAILREGAGKQWEVGIVAAFLRLKTAEVHSEPVALRPDEQPAVA